MGILAKLSELKQHKGFMKYFNNTSWLFAEKILRMVVGLFVGIWVARYLGPENFGMYSYAQSFVALFTVFAALGLKGIVVRELVQDETKRDVLLGTAFVLKLFGAVFVLSLIGFSVFFTNNDPLTNSLIFIIASSTVFQSFNVIDLHFQSKVLSKYVVFSNTVSLFISSIIKVYLLLNEAPLIAFAYVGLFNSFVLSCGFVYFYFKSDLSIFKWLFDFRVAKSLFKSSWPLILGGFVVSIYMKIDQIMIKEMLSLDALGQYAVAVRLSEIWYFIPMGIASSLFPAIINAKTKSKELYYARLQKLYNLMVLIAIVIAIPITFLSDWVVEFLYGKQYNQAGSVLVIHIWAGVFVFLGVASGRWFIAENLQILSFWRTFSGMITNVTLNLILIPKYGIQGAAIATLLSQMTAAYLFDFFGSKTRYTFVMKTKALFIINSWRVK